MIVGAVLSAILLISLIAFPRHLKSVVIGLLLIWTTTAAFVIYDWQRGSQPWNISLQPPASTRLARTGTADPRQLS